MIYHFGDPSLAHAIDGWKTGGFGEDAYPDFLTCECCGERIGHGSDYFDVDGSIYCTACREAAERAVIESVFDEYIYEL